MPDHSAEIAEIESILNSGVTETQVGSTKTKVDHKTLRERLQFLKDDDDTGNQTAKPKVIRASLS